MEIKGTAGERTEKNEVHATGNWRKGNPCYKMTKTQQNYIMQLIGKQNSQVMNLDIQMRFPSKVLNMCPGFHLTAYSKM